MTIETRQQAQFLLARYIKGNTSPEEEIRLFQLVEREENAPAWEEMLEEQILLQEADVMYDRARWQPLIEKITRQQQPARRKSVRLKAWTAAAAILIVLGVAGWWLLTKQDQMAPPHLVRLYNTVSTASGKTLQLTLPDSSKVWLNAKSTLRYPTAFNGQQRVVELVGEGYFEVAKNTTRPFIVRLPARDSAAGGSVEVLGTQFNIKSYQNEPAITATVLEGSIKLSTLSGIPNPQSEIVHAGQQAKLQSSGRIALMNQPDTSSVMAWKEGFFEFRGTIGEFMRELERWYDITVVYENGVPDQELAGRLSRSITLPEIMDVLRTLDIDLRLEGRILIISKK
jgi:ferric-dicitrate binding protein FerR (iron transport regulator)